MKKLLKAGVIATLGMSASAMAGNVGYDFVEAGVGYGEAAGGLADGLNWGLGASWELPANVVIGASHKQQKYDFAKFKYTSAGVGYAFDLGDSFSLLPGVSYERIDANGGHAQGFGLGVAARGRVTSQLELSAGLKYVDLDQGLPGGINVEAGGRYYFRPNLAAGLDFSKPEAMALYAESRFTATLRYEFGAAR